MDGFWFNQVYNSKARGMARFGLLILNKGIWANDTLMKDTVYFKSMVNTSQNLNLAYGYLWWLNGKSTLMVPGSQIVLPGYLIPNAPADLFAALGKNDQKIYIVPSEKLVVIRQGNSAGNVASALSNFDNSLWDYINKLNCTNSGLKELELASEMQKLLFPQELPSNKKMDISGRYIPRHAVGGDFYDFIPLGDEEYIICIGDVSGKGITAALLMANFQATIRTLFKYQRFELTFLLEELNKLVMKNAKGEKFITFFIAHYNAYTRQLQYVNAGHNQPFILSGKNTTLLTEGCIGLGMLDELPFVRVGKMQLQAKSTMVLFTDGVVELENEKGTQFGVEQLIKQVRSFSALKMEDMNDIIFSKLEDWKGSLPYVDDTAIFSCKFF